MASMPSGTGASSMARSISATAASSSSPARTSTASGLRASSSVWLRHGPRLESRGARKALLQLVREARGHATAFTVDGPRGPARVAQPGAVWLSKATGNPVIPVPLPRPRRHWTLRSWDRTQIPKPFTDDGARDRRAVHRAHGTPTTPSSSATGCASKASCRSQSSGAGAPRVARAADRPVDRGGGAETRHSRAQIRPQIRSQLPTKIQDALISDQRSRPSITDHKTTRSPDAYCHLLPSVCRSPDPSRSSRTPGARGGDGCRRGAISAAGGARQSSPARPRMTTCCACTRRGIRCGDDRDARSGGDAGPRHLHVARSEDVARLAAGAVLDGR